MIFFTSLSTVLSIYPQSGQYVIFRLKDDDEPICLAPMSQYFIQQGYHLGMGKCDDPASVWIMEQTLEGLTLENKHYKNNYIGYRNESPKVLVSPKSFLNHYKMKLIERFNESLIYFNDKKDYFMVMREPIVYLSNFYHNENRFIFKKLN